MAASSDDREEPQGEVKNTNWFLQINVRATSMAGQPLMSIISTQNTVEVKNSDMEKRQKKTEHPWQQALITEKNPRRIEHSPVSSSDECQGDFHGRAAINEQHQPSTFFCSLSLLQGRRAWNQASSSFKFLAFPWELAVEMIKHKWKG